MTTTTAELLDLSDLAERGYRFRIGVLLGADEPRISFTARVDHHGEDPDADPDERSLVGRVTMSLLDELDYDDCYELGQKTYDVWVQLYNAELLDERRFSGRVLVIDHVTFHPDHRDAQLAEALLQVIVDHVAQLTDVVVADTSAVDTIEFSRLGFTPAGRSLQVLEISCL